MKRPIIRELHALMMPHPIRRDQALVYQWGRDSSGRWWERYSGDPAGRWGEIKGPARQKKSRTK